MSRLKKSPGEQERPSAAGPRRAASRGGARKATPEPASRVVFLIGSTGSGKSTVGRLLAIRMGDQFLDLEQEISLRAGMATPMIFSRYGEDGYRSLESALLAGILKPEGYGPIIVATGEGVVDTPKNVELMRQKGLVCWLQASFEELLRRLSSEVPLRPAGQDKDAFLRNYDQRSKLYGAAAHVVLPTDQRDPSQIVLELSQRLDEHEKGKSRAKGSGRARSH